MKEQDFKEMNQWTRFWG